MKTLWEPPQKLVVVVTGSRNATDRQLVFDFLDDFHKRNEIFAMAHGGATGIDTFCGEWTNVNDIRCFIFHPQWEKYGKAAGPRRNEHMLKMMRPKFLIAFPGGRGTQSMINLAKKHKIEIITGE